jgi:hypothetical protein
VVFSVGRVGFLKATAPFAAIATGPLPRRNVGSIPRVTTGVSAALPAKCFHSGFLITPSGRRPSTTARKLPAGSGEGVGGSGGSRQLHVTLDGLLRTGAVPSGMDYY